MYVSQASVSFTVSSLRRRADRKSSILLLGSPPERALDHSARSFAAIPDLDDPLADDRDDIAAGTRERGRLRRCWFRYASRADRRSGCVCMAGLDPPSQPCQPSLGGQGRHAERNRPAELLPCHRQIAPRTREPRLEATHRKLAFQRRATLATETIVQRIAMMACRADALNHRLLLQTYDRIQEPGTPCPHMIDTLFRR